MESCITTQTAYEENQAWLNSRDKTAYEIMRFLGCIVLASILYALFFYFKRVYF